MKLHRRSKYRVIYADPPWPEYGGGKIKRGADRHYPLMPIAAILRLGEPLQPHTRPGWNYSRAAKPRGGTFGAMRSKAASCLPPSRIMQTTKRRSRMRRIRSGKRIELTERDIDLFELLNRYHFLRSNFLYAFLGGNSETRFKERLGHLYHDGRYINRPEQQWQFANCRHMPVIYELDDRGEQVLRERGLIHSDSPLLKKGRMGAYRQFAHGLMICDCMASIELGVRQDLSLRFISWQEIVGKAPESTRKLANPFAMPVSISHTLPRTGATQRADIKAVPDGLFGLEYAQGGSKAYRFFALEADRNTLPVTRSDLHQTSYLRKILAYRQISAQSIHKSHLGLPNLFVLTVTTNEPHMANVMSLVRELTHEGKSRLFLFKTLSSIGDFKKAPEPTAHILTDSWQRVGYEAFRIDRP